MEKVNNGYDAILFPTHNLFLQLRNPACPICGTPIVAGDLVHLEPWEGGLIMYSHAECFHGEPDQTAV